MSNKDLRENLLAARLESLIKWSVDNSSTVLTATGLLVAAGLITSVFTLRRSELRDSQWTRLALAESFIGQKQFPQAEQILNEVLPAAASNDIFLHASFFLGEAAYQEQKYEEAVRHFSNIVNNGSASPVKALALAHLGTTFEQMKDYAQAARAYQNFVQSYPDHFMGARIQLAWGRTLTLAGNKTESRKVLSQLIDLYPTSTWAENARSIMDKFAVR